MQDRNWDRVFEQEDFGQERQQAGRGREPVRGGAALHQDRPASHREQPWHPGDGPHGLRPGDLRAHVNEGYDHQEQYERAAPADRGPRGYRRTDERIHEDVCEALAENDELDVSEVEVRVQDGEVTLMGTVESRDVRRAVEDIVESVRGVEQVLNQIRVQRAGGQRAA